MNFNPDNMIFFYLTLSIVLLAFALVAVFGTTEDRAARRKGKRITAS